MAGADDPQTKDHGNNDPSHDGPPGTGPLAGLRVLDLTRVLAGPICTQMLGDLGADVIKVERPGDGDDTRAWGPPYLKDEAGQETAEAAYYLSANRNKRSVTIDLSRPEGQALVRRLLAHCDILVENFKVGGLARYGLDYGSVSAVHPRLVYCSITGFGQTGPRAHQPGYDFMIQAMGGIMSLTGAADGPPTKVGVAAADMMCGMQAAIAILAALEHRRRTGAGQHIDIGLFDTQVSWLINEALNYFVSGKVPQRMGNAHPNLAPYQVLPTSDGHVVLAIGNDAQFRRFCEHAGQPELATDERFRDNARRVTHRAALDRRLAAIMQERDTADWVAGLTALGVPCGPIQDVAEVFADPQTDAREMAITMPHPAGEVRLVGNPLKFSRAPVNYRRPPPLLGEHTEEVLRELLGLDAARCEELRRGGVI